MKPKTLLTVLLLAFVGASVLFLIGKEIRDRAETATSGAAVPAPSPAPGATASPGANAVQPAHQVIAYYFHGRARCPNCLKIEAYTREAIQSGFAEELKNGRLVWRVINVEEPGNRHFVQDYQLFTKTVILSDLHYGQEKRWKLLDQVWTFLPDQTAFMNYIAAEVRLYLAEDK